MLSFDYIEYDDDRKMFRELYDLLLKLNLLDWFKSFKPDHRGYVLTKNNNISLIIERFNSDKDGLVHTKTHLEWILRQLHYVLSNGTTAHKVYLSNHSKC
jgi:hypothetical protein